MKINNPVKVYEDLKWVENMKKNGWVTLNPENKRYYIHFNIEEIKKNAKKYYETTNPILPLNNR